MMMKLLALNQLQLNLKNNIKVFVGTCYSLCVLCILILCLIMKIDKYILALSVFFVSSLIYQLKIFKINSPKSCLMAFRTNNLTGIFIFVFIFSFIL